MKRGDIITIVLSGDYGKPRPGLIIQSDLFIDTNSVTIIPLTSHLIDAPLLRIQIEPTPDNALKTTSQIMIDKVYTMPREKIGENIGHIDSTIMLAVERALMVFIGLA